MTRSKRWLLGLAAAVLAAAAVWSASAQWTASIARGLVCSPSDQPTEALIVDYFDPEYLLFERARKLREARIAGRVLVPIPVGPDGTMREVERLIAEVMISTSKLGSVEFVPVHIVEPITLNAVKDIRSYVLARGIRSLVVVTPLFRSRRTALVYGAVFKDSGVYVGCAPGPATAAESWTNTWHGVQNVSEQWLKLQYYRFWVL